MNFITEPKLIYKNLPRTSKCLFNYKQATQDIQQKDDNLKNMNCEYHRMKAKYKINDHVYTGNMYVLKHILTNNNQQTIKKIIYIMQKGVEYIETPLIYKQKIFFIFKEALDKYTQKLIDYSKKKNKKDIEKFTNWKWKVLKEINRHIQNIQHLPQQELVSQRLVKQAIKTLHLNFVITCIDKLPNNYNIICKKYWLLALHNLTLGDTNKRYMISKLTDNQIIQSHKYYLNNLKFKVTQKLPSKYVTRKMHKPR